MMAKVHRSSISFGDFELIGQYKDYMHALSKLLALGIYFYPLEAILNRLFCIIFFFFYVGQSHASELQILHTNDLHGFFEHTIFDKELGGYAQVKYVMDSLKADAREKGIETLTLDAGDFMEGNLFYMADRGRRTWGIMSKMGYDAVAVGNHDFLMGTTELNEILKENQPEFAYLAANFKVNFPALYSGIKNNIKDYKVFHVNGFKVAVIGLTTDEIFYGWAFKAGKIKNPVKIGNKLAKKLKTKKIADFVIALTHNGFLRDVELAESSEHIDLIVGGHSHSLLHNVVYKQNKNLKRVPIVQAGSHGSHLGKLILSLDNEFGLTVKKYKLVPIKSSYKKDEVVSDYVNKSKELIYDLYGKDFLNEKVGYANIPLVNRDDKLTPWTAFVTDAIKESVDADISFHTPRFGGSGLPIGPISREDVFNSHPRFFDLDAKEGWQVYHADVYGVILKSVIRFALKGQYPLSFSGVTFDIIGGDDSIKGDDFSFEDGEILLSNPEIAVPQFLGLKNKFQVTNIRVNGEPLKALRKYRVALSEGIVLGGLGISGVVKYLLKKVVRSDISLVESIISKMKIYGPIGADYGTYLDKKENSKTSYKFVPYNLLR